MPVRIIDPVTGGVVVEMSMNKHGADVWGKMTTDNVGKPIAITLDDVVYSAPVVNGPITRWKFANYHGQQK